MLGPDVSGLQSQGLSQRQLEDALGAQVEATAPAAAPATRRSVIGSASIAGSVEGSRPQPMAIGSTHADTMARSVVDVDDLPGPGLWFLPW